MPKKKKEIIDRNLCSKKPYRKQNIPFEHKCYVDWCENIINPFDYHVGHDQPESKGGTLDINNIKPICARCNLSMSDNYTIAQWNVLSGKKERKFLNCF